MRWGERAKESQMKTVVLLFIQINQSKAVNIRMPMVATVRGDKDKITNNGDVNSGDRQLLLSQWFGQQLEARLRSMDWISLKLKRRADGTGD